MKNNFGIIILFIGAFIWFILFAYDITYDKDFSTWMHLAYSIILWTFGLLAFIDDRIDKKEK